MKDFKPYSIQKVSNENYLVISKDITRFDDLLPELSNDLKKKKIKGDIVLDLLLSNGNTASRFFSIFFNGDIFILPSLKKISAPEDFILEKVNAFFRKHKDILKDGVLTNNEIERILKVL